MATYRDDIFAGKVMFCTGGRSGIGYGVAEEMMRHGAEAIIVGRDDDGLQESAKRLARDCRRRCKGVAADVRDPVQMKAAVDVARAEYGRIDFVVCAAAGNFLAPISGLSENAFKTVVDIDLLGTYNTIKATLPLVRESQGAYLHVSATLHYRGLPYQAHVSAAKAGVDALSAVLAVEEGPRGVRSNVIAPGPIDNTAGMSKLSTGQTARQTVPLGRFGQPRDIANAAVFLFSDAAAWVNGAIFVVDGGEHHIRPIMAAYPDVVLDPVSFKSKL